MKRFSLNQATTKHWPLPDLAAGCVAQGVTQVGLWRADVQAYGVEETAALMRDSGLSVTTLCRGGFFSAPGWLSDNRRAIEEAATLGAPVLVLVSGGLPEGSRDIDAARAYIRSCLAELVPYALAAGVQLAIEPLHPMFAADRCVVSTLGQALDLASPFPARAVGVCVDTYHIWWDDHVWAQLERAGAEGRIACFQLADWITPLPAGVLLGRGLPGTGCVELRRFRAAVDATGFTGPVEVEVFNEQVWARPGAEVLAEVLHRCRDLLGPAA
ncbi:sugar phosphate isomerase/epimerase [Actinoplanes sp. N902-109]|uniref:sugar phosphate isomerase/epimerase family protein n=1 Tax=Actinoplanes sp. (strain N902-109) TaxID=649831 RepID=UPI0003295712|nr:sugar phosphate isomerase/epimerase family protein [Actinoplanes sp. N902-109]AGL17673.1 xylose isomerase domain-containing protein [Actinoplanes sp. N902-109]